VIRRHNDLETFYSSIAKTKQYILPSHPSFEIHISLSKLLNPAKAEVDIRIVVKELYKGLSVNSILIPDTITLVKQTKA
jgi:hypothetical protein